MIAANAARAACLFAASLIFSVAAEAQVFRAYLSSKGDDLNPCSLAAPCRLLPAALNAVASGGEIWMLDSANYNTSTVTVAKSVSILAVPGALGSIVATGASHGLLVSGPSIVVSLRNLVFTNLTSSIHGVAFTNGLVLNVNQCEFRNIGSAAIYANTAGGYLNVRDTIVRDSGFGVQVEGSTQAAVEAFQVTGGGYGIFGTGNTRVSATGANFSGMTTGVALLASGGAPRLAIRDSIVGNVSYGVFVQALAGGETARVTATRVGISNASLAAFAVAQSNGGASQIAADGNTITDSNIAFHFLTASIGTINSRSNNVLNGVTTNVAGGGSVTSLGGL